MRNLLFILTIALTLLGCEGVMTTQNTKPTITEFNPPDGNVEVVSGTPQTAGYTDGVDYIKGANYNAFWRQEFRVADYLLNDEREIFVESTSGDDTTGDGTEALPYKTIAKAYSMIAPNAYTKITLAETGDYLISEDIEQRNKIITIKQGLGITAHVKFDTWVAAKNNIYEIQMYGVSVLNIVAANISVNPPVNIALEWDEYAGAIKVYGGISRVNLVATTGDMFISATGAAGAEKPALVAVATDDDGDIGYPIVSLYGSFLSNDNGYALETNGQNAALNSIGTIDNSVYWVGGGVDMVKPTLLSCVVGDTTAAGTTLSIRAGSEAIAVGVGDGTVAESKVADLLTAAYTDISAGDVSGFKTTVGGNLVLITGIIASTSAAVIIGDIKSTANTTTYCDVTQGFVRKNNNIISNIEEIYQ